MRLWCFSFVLSICICISLAHSEFNAVQATYDKTKNNQQKTSSDSHIYDFTNSRNSIDQAGFVFFLFEWFRVSFSFNIYRAHNVRRVKDKCRDNQSSVVYFLFSCVPHLSSTLSYIHLFQLLRLRRCYHVLPYAKIVCAPKQKKKKQTHTNTNIHTISL